MDQLSFLKTGIIAADFQIIGIIYNLMKVDKSSEHNFVLYAQGMLYCVLGH